jgi:uncharacterized membrane protein YhdT
MKSTLFFLTWLATLIAGALFGPKWFGSYCLTTAILSIALWFVIRVLRN